VIFVAGPTNIITAFTNIVGTTTNITYTTNVANVLNIQSAGDGWENNTVGGFYLYKFVPGNFQAAVHIQSMAIAAFNQPGILARAYTTSNGIAGYPLGYAQTNGNGTNTVREYWISLSRFDEFNIGTYARRNIDGTVTQNSQTDPGPIDPGGAPGTDTNLWLLIIRSGDGSQFDFYKRVHQTDPWVQIPNRTHYSLPVFANKPMQVGLMSGPFNGASATQLPVSFEHFLLDVLPPNLSASNGGGGNVNVSWAGGGAFILQATPSLSPANWQTVTAPITTNNGNITVTVPTTNWTEFFRLSQ